MHSFEDINLYTLKSLALNHALTLKSINVNDKLHVKQNTK